MASNLNSDLPEFFRYELLFQQKVTSEDIFLGMGNKNPSTACCEDLVVCALNYNMASLCNILLYVVTVYIVKNACLAILLCII